MTNTTRCRLSENASGIVERRKKTKTKVKHVGGFPFITRSVNISQTNYFLISRSVNTDLYCKLLVLTLVCLRKQYAPLTENLYFLIKRFTNTRRQQQGDLKAQPSVIIMR